MLWAVWGKLDLLEKWALLLPSSSNIPQSSLLKAINLKCHALCVIGGGKYLIGEVQDTTLLYPQPHLLVSTCDFYICTISGGFIIAEKLSKLLVS